MPKHVSWLFGDDEILYQTDGYSGSDADIDSTERYTSDIDLTVETGSSIDFKFDGTDATDDWYLQIYNRRNNAWEAIEEGWKSLLTVSNDGTETIYHYTIPETYQPGHYRFGMVRTGSTTTFEMLVTCIRWRKTESKA